MFVGSWCDEQYVFDTIVLALSSLRNKTHQVLVLEYISNKNNTNTSSDRYASIYFWRHPIITAAGQECPQNDRCAGFRDHTSADPFYGPRSETLLNQSYSSILVGMRG